jgi:hypothetical protein
MPNEPPTPPQPPVRPPGLSDAAWAEILARVAAGTSTYDRLLGSGKDLWESDEEFEQFMEFLRDIRRADG